MLEVQLGKPSRSTPRVKDIKPGTVFFGSFNRGMPIIPLLSLRGNTIASLTTFELVIIASSEFIIYNYEEIPDALLTRTSVAGLFADLHPVSDSRVDGRDFTEKMDVEETT